MKVMTSRERRYWQQMAEWNREREEIRLERVRASRQGGRG